MDRGAASPGAGRGLPRPPEIDGLFTDEGWALLTQERRLSIIEVLDHDDEEYSEETCRIHDEIIVGDGDIDYPPTPFLLSNDFEGSIESIGQPWRIFCDPDAVLELLRIADDYHWEVEKLEREAMLQGRHFAIAPKCQDDGCCSTSGNEDELLELMCAVKVLYERIENLEKKEACSKKEIELQRSLNAMILNRIPDLQIKLSELTSKLDCLNLYNSAKKLLRSKNCVYLVGGTDGTNALPWLDSFTPSLAMLNPLESLTVPRYCSSSVALGGKIYVLGGYDGFKLLDTVDCYDTKLGSWTPFPALTRKNWCFAGVSIHEKICAFGGGDDGGCFNEVEVFDAAHGKWIKNQAMIEKRCLLGGVQLNGAIYAVGGFNGTQVLSSTERSDPRDPGWKMLPTMNTGRHCHTLAVLNEKIYSIGGLQEDGRAVATVEMYDPRMPSWVMVNPMKFSRGYHSSAVLDGSIFTFGGVQEINGKALNVVECYNEGASWVDIKVEAVGSRYFFSAIAL
ncbi:hypothetical protein ACQ4PT_010070 [Festuca glaucescens]